MKNRTKILYQSMLVEFQAATGTRRHVLMMTDPNSPEKTIRLTRRQRQCLRLLAEGKTARACALELGISVRMVRMHLQIARMRLGAASSTHAVAIALKNSLLD